MSGLDLLGKLDDLDREQTIERWRLKFGGLCFKKIVRIGFRGLGLGLEV